MEEKEASKSTAKKAVRRTTAKKVSASSTLPTASATVRKAPARNIPLSSPVKKSGKLSMLVMGVALFLVLLGVSALIGLSDKGQLDVEGKIIERKQSASPEDQEALRGVPTQQAESNTPNGGLVGTGNSAPQIVPEVSTTTDESSTSTASTTEDASVENTATDEGSEAPIETDAEVQGEAVMQ